MEGTLIEGDIVEWLLHLAAARSLGGDCCSLPARGLQWLAWPLLLLMALSPQLSQLHCISASIVKGGFLHCSRLSPLPSSFITYSMSSSSSSSLKIRDEMPVLIVIKYKMHLTFFLFSVLFILWTHQCMDLFPKVSGHINVKLIQEIYQCYPPHPPKKVLIDYSRVH